MESGAGNGDNPSNVREEAEDLMAFRRLGNRSANLSAFSPEGWIVKCMGEPEIEPFTIPAPLLVELGSVSLTFQLLP